MIEFLGTLTSRFSLKDLGAAGRRPIVGSRLDAIWEMAPSLAAFFVALSVYLYFFVGIYIDDAFITLSYVKTLAGSGVWGMNEALRSNAATSPLNVLLLAGVTTVVRDPVMAVYLLTIALAVSTFLSLRYFSRRIFRNDIFAYGTTALLFSNPLLISTMGLESFLIICLLMAVCVAFHAKRIYALGVLVGLLVLARPDGAVTVFIVMLLLLHRPYINLARYLGAMLAVLCPWYFYSWYFLGSLLPDTFFMKLNEDAWGSYQFVDGPALYLSRFPIATPIAIAMCLVLPAILAFRKNRVVLLLTAILLGTAISQYAAYSLLKAPPYHWYYAWGIASGIILGSLALLLSFKDRFLPRLVIVAVVASGAAVSLWDATQHREMPINTNWASTDQYRAIAEWINDNYSGRSFHIWGELGVIQYYTKANAVDQFSDREWILNALMSDEQRSILHSLLRLNFANLGRDTVEPANFYLSSPCEGRSNVMKRWTVRSRYQDHETYCFYQGHS